MKHLTNSVVVGQAMTLRNEAINDGHINATPDLGLLSSKEGSIDTAPTNDAVAVRGVSDGKVRRKN